MEALGEFVPDLAPGPYAGYSSLSPRPALSAVAVDRQGRPKQARVRQEAATDHSAGLPDPLDTALEWLEALAASAVTEYDLVGLPEAADFADRVEAASRRVEFLQIVAAEAVDRARRRAASEIPPAYAEPTGWGASPSGGEGSWLTGWRDTGAGTDRASKGAAADGIESPAAMARGAGVMTACPDDGYRNTTEFLRARLRISITEAKRRLSLTSAVLPQAGIAGRRLPPARQELAEAVASGVIATRAATIITLSLDRVRHTCAPEVADRMEHALTRTAVENDHDFLTRIARRWTEALDQDGAEPSEAELRRLQGAFIRPTRRGLQHLEIFATTDQFEHLLTVMNVATNPRSGVPAHSKDADPGAEGLDQRSRPQKLLDGLVGACQAALASGGLPAAGGLRPQVMVTIDYRDLLERLGGSEPGAAGLGRKSGMLQFAGPVTASTVRRIACDADVIPVLLGGEGRVLDIGRTSRVFPPHIRKAITARDGGCAFPQCTIPASWCEAHHIDYWSRGGTTGTDNGTLLCSHHHHLIHREEWTIQLQSGIPWFLPPPHIDPRQTPRRNSYFRLD
jgi:hypothetical protein